MKKEQTHSNKQRAEASHLRPVWIISALLLFTLTVTVLYFREIKTSDFFPGNILVLTLLEINLILLILLVLLLSRNLIKHYFERRKKIPGAGFRGKLIAAFVGFSSIPAVLLLIVASGLLTSSVENWFSIQVERPLDSALHMAKFYYQKQEEAALDHARTLGAILSTGSLLSEENRSNLSELMKTKREEYRVAGLELFFHRTSAPLQSLDPKIPNRAFPSPSKTLLERSFSGETLIEKPLTRAGNLIRALVPVYAVAPDQNGQPVTKAVQAVLLVDVLIPEELVQNMEEITRSSEDYKQLKAFKNPIKESYLLSFVVITVVILFSATWFGFYLAKGITVPLQKLAEGTRAIAQGDLSFRISVKADDELGVLVNSFNKMTEDLRTGKTQLEEVNRSLLQSNLELDQRRTYIETVLEDIATGVISLDSQARITTVNHSAERIFQVSNQEIRGKLARDAFQAKKLSSLTELLDEMENRSLDTIERELHVEVGGRILTLQVNMTRLRNEHGLDLGKVIVVEDLTELIKAQKAAAWQEVAQHIAHEIKNPLTPIQLSAERLRKKFAEQAADFPQVLEDSATTIMNEVRGLKGLVDEFSHFARLPAPRFSRQDIHAVLQEVVQLYKGAHRDLEVQTQYDPALPSLNIDREQLRRVLVNLFENAVEAMDHRGHLWITTQYDQDHKKAVITVSDDGTGILPEDQDKLFLPYFSRKKSGTGLGLAIVHRIVKEHDGTIAIANREPRGTQVTIELPV
jgi:two-component system nitrogen regulation sensor histidine kinase NtrY